jgi:hypothetical protein
VYELGINHLFTNMRAIDRKIPAAKPADKSKKEYKKFQLGECLLESHS